MAHVDDGQLNALLDGQLAEADAGAVRKHLESCAECRARFEEAQRFLREAGAMLELLLPDAKAAPRISRVSTKAKERAVEADAPTQQSPAVRPIFKREGVAPVAAPAVRRRHVPWTGLAWAASVILAVGLGYRWQALRPAERPQNEVALAPAPASAAPAASGATANDALQRTDRQAAASATRGAGAPTRRTLVKPAGARGAPKALPEEVLAHLPPPTGRRDERGALAGAGAESRVDSAHGAAGVTVTPTLGAAAPAAPSVDRTAPARAPSPAAQAPAPPSSRQYADRANVAADNRLEEAAVQVGNVGFRKVSLEEAVRRLSGSIRLIDGMQPVRVEVGLGRLVAGAAPDRDVVRVIYADASGRPLFLDQQPGETREGASVNGLMPGDTLVTPTPSGALQVRWVDRRNCWLSLTGAASADSLRALVERIR
jgi:hypothetical protein